MCKQICIAVSILFPVENEEVRLHKYLLNKTDESLYVRPVYNTSETVRVNVGVALIQIYGLVSIKITSSCSIFHKFMIQEHFPSNA